MVRALQLGNGCSIYAGRPKICRNYACAWLVDGTIPDYWFPQHSKMVLQNELEVVVDERFPNRWREEPYLSWLRVAALEEDVRVFVGGREFLR